ncbi:SIMPL domain-containing protein [Paeniglutamicibacter antarcticus]|uniref:SIMPL domain-containing protein n=1 Tax=Arthrobacter terrae TaxID=2935737 RepID=A0A931G445_9MICC|nr:SIMPL domain-containing protein [Arthrobacter terrae]MBG0739361.1 SIMPL domain-containing protein [Arthrobacter terrae]
MTARQQQLPSSAAADPPTGPVTGAEPAAGPGQVTVTGRGSCSQAPDRLTVSVGIETRHSSVPDAYCAAAAAVTAILARLQTLGITATDISSNALNVRAETSWQEGSGNVVTGYLVSSSMAVKLDYGSEVQDVIAATVEAGGNDVRLNGLEPSVADPSRAAARARELAWADAAAKAGQFAALAGRSLGPVHAVIEGESAAVGPVPVPLMARASSVTALPLAAGETSVDASVTVTWELY